MAKSRTIINQTNNIVYVEPNYSNSTNMYDSGGLETFELTPDLEDYSIFVNLEIETIGRTIQTGNKVYKFSYISKGGDESVNLMSGTKINTTDGSSINSLTTNWTDTHISDLKSVGASVELFGINYIDIAYNHFMVPEVTIEFVDIRGASVFAQKELFETNNMERAIGGNYDDNIVNTFFQCFFTFPYPKFSLLVKGFYGQPVAYELTCSDFRARFNSDTGNFSCTAKFVGYQFSFLNDVMLNAIVAAPYSDFLGADYWNQQGFKFKGYNNGEVNIPKIGELLKKMKEAETAAEQISQSSPEVQEKNNVEHLTKRLSAVKERYEYYLQRIKEVIGAKTESDGIELLITDMEDHNISEGALVMVEFEPSYTFEDYFNDRDGVVNGAYEGLLNEVKEFNSDFTSISLPEPKNFADEIALERVFKDDKNNNFALVDTKKNNDDILNNAPNLYRAFEAKVLSENDYNNNKVNKYIYNNYGYFYNDGGFGKALSNALKDATERESTLAEKISENKTNALAQRLGFFPSVENITKIMMAHFETFAHMIYETAAYIENENPKRDTNKVGITNDDDISDVPEIYRSENGYLLIPPFPKLTKIVEKNGTRNREESWVGDYGNMFKETDLVHGILNGIEEFVKIAQETSDNTGVVGSTTNVSAVMKHPLSPLDFLLTNKIYTEYDEKDVPSLLGLVTLRVLQILGLTNISGWNSNCEVLGRAEAENLLDNGKITDSLKNRLKYLSTRLDSVMSMIEGKETSDIKKDSSGAWPWCYNDNNTPIVSNGDFNICCISGVSGNEMYTLPVQNLSWNKIKKEVKDKKSASSDDYFNVSESIFKTNRYKNNIFNIETNINRIKNICENQLKGIDGIETYSEKILNESTYDSEKYEDFFLDLSIFKKINGKSILAYPIKDADKLVPSDKSSMIPCTTNYLQKMSWGEGYNMDDFVKVDLGGKWKDKDGNEVQRIKDNGYNDFFTDLNTNKYTLTEIHGLDDSLYPDDDLETSLFTQSLYYMQTNDKTKAFMTLCSLGYLYDYVKIFSSELCSKDKTFSIIPLSSILFAGGIIWAKENYTNGVFVNCSPTSKTINECFKLLDKLDGQVKLKFKRWFLNWVDNGVQNNSVIVSFKELKNNMEFNLLRDGLSYEAFFSALGELKDTDEKDKKKMWFNQGVFVPKNDKKPYDNLLEFFVGELGDNFFRNYICVDKDLGGKGKTLGFRVGNRDGSPGVKQYVDLGLAPCLFTKSSKFFFALETNSPRKINVPMGNIKSFFKGFLERIAEDVTEAPEDNSVSQAKKTETTTDIKVGVYRYCKLLYDKWIGGMSKDDFKNFTMEKFFESDDRYFHFIDAYYNYANEIPVNIGDFCDKIKESYMNADYSLLAFLSSVYSQNKFNFICIQNFLDLSKRENMMNMFDCIPYTEYWDVQRHPNFIVNYAYEASSHLEIDGSEYENDGFMINMPESTKNKYPEALKSRSIGVSSGYNVPAFGVSYGKMYQSYFKDINISMDNPTVTEQSIKAQFAIACQNNENTSQPDESKEYTYGQDLYSIYSNSSYECEVTMMGCAWVQPLMLFVLNNVPMFRGTYQIINVTHHIEQGDMVTKFKGVRMANVTTRIVEDCSVNKTLNQTNGGINTEVNQQYAFANIDNDCPYEEFPLVIPGQAGGGIPQSFLNTKFGDFSGGNIQKWVQGSTPLSPGITANMTIEQVLGAAIAAEYQGFSQNNYLMLKLATAMVCNRYHWCNSHNSWIRLFGTKQQGTGNRNASLDTYNKVKRYIEPILLNGPGSLVGEVAKVKKDWNVEMWNKGKTNHKKAPSTHVITEDDMRRIFAYSTAIGYDYEHLNQYKGNQTRFECKDIPNNGNCSWHKADFLIEEYNTVFTSNPDKPDETFWDPAPPIENNGDNKVSKFANAFLDALNKTSQSSAVKVMIGIDKSKSKGDNIFLTNAKKDTNFGRVLDMMLQAYSGIIEEIQWIVPGENGNQSLPPAGYFVKLKKGSNNTIVRVISEKDNKQVNSISVSNEGGINSDFRKAIVKKYKDNQKAVTNNVKPSMSDADIDALFKNNNIANCNTVMMASSNNTTIDGPITTSNWDVGAFVRNLHYWQSHTCEEKHKSRSSYGGCGVCTGVINRALRDTGFGQKYFKTYPWEVYAAMKADNSDFIEIDSNTQSSSEEFKFRVNLLQGDICTMWSTPNKEKHFHTCAYDGNKWISDFVQNTCNVYRSSSPCQMVYHIFRHK